MNNVENLIEEYRSEVIIATSSFFAWKTINNLATTNNEILRALNANALSWNIITHSLLITFFTAMGRIFDGDSRSLTVHSFISKCESEIAQFSKLALEARKLRNTHGVRPEWLNDYLQEAYEPIAADFEELAKFAKQHAATYKSNYKPVRDKVIAHKDFTTIGNKEALFAETKIVEVQKILQFLHQVERVVVELHMNGRKSSLTEHKFDQEQHIGDDLTKLLRKLLTQ
jgi:hypothetical protein